MDPHLASQMHPSAWPTPSLMPWLASALSAIDHRLILLLERQAVMGETIERHARAVNKRLEHLEVPRAAAPAPRPEWAHIVGMAALALLGLTGILKPAEIKAVLLALAGG